MKRFISVMLIALLCAGMLPTAAFADASENSVEMEETMVAENNSADNVNEEAGSTEEKEAAEESEEAGDETRKEEAVEETDLAGSEADEKEEGLKAPQMPEAPEAPEAPEQPDLEGLSDEEANQLIAAYNEKVDAYNADVEAYNSRMDEYSQQVELYNEKVNAYNEEAALLNAEAEAHNQLEDEKEAAANAVMEKYNQRKAVYDKNVATIERLDSQHKEKIQPQMEMLGDIGRVDAESILALGTVLTEDYTVKVGRRNVQLGKAGDLVVSWDDLAPTSDHVTIQVNEGASQSGTTYKVANLHIYQDFADFGAMNDYMAERGWDCMNINLDDSTNSIIIPAALIEHLAMMEFEIVQADANDSVTVKNQYTVFGQEGNLTNPRFLDGYTDGSCWYPAGTTFMTNAADYDCDWTGTAHTFSFENGTCDRSTVKNTLNINTYVFNRYNNPEPVKPEVYEAQRKEILPILSSMENALTALTDLSRMDLREILIPVEKEIPEEIPAPEEIPEKEEIPVIPQEPEAETEPQAPAEPEVPEDSAAPAAPVIPVFRPQPKAEEKPEEDNEPSDAVIIEENLVPLSAHVPAEEMVIEDAPAPLAAASLEMNVEERMESGHGGSWSLVNLILSLLAALAAIIKLIRRRNEGVREIKIAGILPAAAALILFILTNDMRLPMALTDRWTPVMALLFIAAAALLIRRKAREEEQA